MPNYKVDICGINTATLPLLDSNTKTKLLKRIKAGDTAAREEFIRGNLRLVLSIAHRFTQSGEDIDDLFQIGCIGMIKAIDNFDITQNLQFSTYAVPMISGEIKRYLRDTKSPIRISRSLKDTAYKALRAREHMTRNNHLEPTIAEISAEIGVNSEDIVLALEAIQTPVSIYEPLYTEGTDTFCVKDQISDTKTSEDNWVTSFALKDALMRLSPKEQEIIRMRYFDGKTQIEAAAALGISQAQVSRIEKQALRALRANLC